MKIRKYYTKQFKPENSNNEIKMYYITIDPMNERYYANGGGYDDCVSIAISSSKLMNSLEKSKKVIAEDKDLVGLEIKKVNYALGGKIESIEF